jgi:ribosomal protein S27E
MPIRFRCAYCNQLLGIARRKANQVVRCPTCAGEVVVPEPEGGDGEPEPQQVPANQPVFERSDFEDLFNDPVVAGPAVVKPAPPPQPAPPPPPLPAAPPAPARNPPGGGSFDGDRLGARTEPPPPGIFLTPAKATVITVVFILALAVAFVTGWLIGRFVVEEPPAATRR